MEKQVKKQLRFQPEGHLKCITNHGSLQYYINGKYVKKSNLKQAKAIAQRDYNKQVLTAIENEILTLRAFLNCHENSLSTIYDSLPEGRKTLVTPITPPIEERIQTFLSEPYTPLPFRDEDTSEIITENGERVRSKSEKMIADKLHTLGIPYRYEKPLPLSVAGATKIFHPDFTIMHKRTGKIMYLEHFGMMDNPEYCTNAINKIEIYEKNGYLLGDKLIITKETSQVPLNISIMEEYFTKFLT